MTAKVHPSQQHLEGDKIWRLADYFLFEQAGTVVRAAIQEGNLRYFVRYTKRNGAEIQEWVPAHLITPRFTNLFGE